jgi:hypothetical protein
MITAVDGVCGYSKIYILVVPTQTFLALKLDFVPTIAGE